MGIYFCAQHPSWIASEVRGERKLKEHMKPKGFKVFQHFQSKQVDEKYTYSHFKNRNALVHNTNLILFITQSLIVDMKKQPNML